MLTLRVAEGFPLVASGGSFGAFGRQGRIFQKSV